MNLTFALFLLQIYVASKNFKPLTTNSNNSNGNKVAIKKNTSTVEGRSNNTSTAEGKSNNSSSVLPTNE